MVIRHSPVPDRVRVKLVELYGRTEPYASVSLMADLRDRIEVILNAPQDCQRETRRTAARDKDRRHRPHEPDTAHGAARS